MAGKPKGNPKPPKKVGPNGFPTLPRERKGPNGVKVHKPYDEGLAPR